MNTKRHLPLTLLLVLALVTIGCGSDDSAVDVGSGTGDGSTIPDDPDRDADSGTRPTLKGLWILENFTLEGSDVTLPDGEIDMTIGNGRIRGNGGCNSFGGQVDATDSGAIAIVEMSWTEMACEEPGRMDFEAKYLPALAGVTSWSASPAGITFSSDTASLSYGPGDPPATLPLEGTVWELDTVFSGAGVDRAASTTDRSKPPVTLTFVGDGMANLTSDDCGPISLTVEYGDGVDGNMVVADRDTIDKPSCDDPGSNMVTAIDALFETTGFMVDESRLTLIGLSGELVGFRGE